MADNEGARKTGEAYVVCTTPDVCLTSGAPVPYSIISYLDTASMEVATVRMTGMCALTMDSHLTTVSGDEAGSGGGITSGVNLGFCVPITHSSTVRASGSYILYHSSEFWMNCPSPKATGNTKGKLVYVKVENLASISADGTLIESAPMLKPETTQEKSWWDTAWTRAVGLLKTIGGVIEMSVGGGLLLVPEPTMLTKVGGGAALVHGADTTSAGLMELWTGEERRTVTAQALEGGAKLMGIEDGTARTIGDIGDAGLGIVLTVGGSVVLRSTATGVQVTRSLSGTGAFIEGAEGGSGLGILANKEIRVSAKGLEIVEQHLAQFGEHAPNAAMVQRLKDALASGAAITGADASFYLHEVAEATLMKSGIGYEAAHAGALVKYGVSEFSVYHPEVIKSLPEHFNSNWFNFWGLTK